MNYNFPFVNENLEEHVDEISCKLIKEILSIFNHFDEVCSCFFFIKPG